MKTESANYELKSDLARWSMPSQRSQTERRLAWTNSTCLLFLLIGIVGARTRTPVPRIPAPLEEAAPIIIITAPPPPPETLKREEQPEPEKTPAAVVVVVPDAPSINFSIPTVGTLIAPAALAQAPPANPLEERAPVSVAPTHLDYTDASGGRPAPEEYPPLAQRLHQEGTVTLLMSADENGRIFSAEVKQTSGSTILDRAAKDFVTLHWRLPKGQAGHLFEASIQYILMK